MMFPLGVQNLNFSLIQEHLLSDPLGEKCLLNFDFSVLYMLLDRASFVQNWLNFDFSVQYTVHSALFVHY